MLVVNHTGALLICKITQLQQTAAIPFKHNLLFYIYNNVTKCKYEDVECEPFRVIIVKQSGHIRYHTLLYLAVFHEVFEQPCVLLIIKALKEEGWVL